MEQLNRVELRGIIGNVRHTQISAIKMARFTVATSTAFKKADGGVAIDTQWTTCCAWSGKVIPLATIKSLEKGKKVHLTGRLRTAYYKDSDGDDRTLVEVLVGTLEIIDDEESLTLEGGPKNDNKE